MNLHVPFFLLFLVSEIILGFLFIVAAHFYDDKATVDLKSIIKGIIERGFLTVCLVNNYPHALTLFGALKLGTRLKRDDTAQSDSKGFNDYFLLGNFVSVAAAIFYTTYYPAGI